MAGALGPDLCGIGAERAGAVDESVQFSRQPCEARGKGIGGRAIYLFWSTELDKPALPQDPDLVCQGERLGLIVGYVDRRCPALPGHGRDLDAEVFPQVRIEVGEGLVEKDERRTAHERSGQSYSLLAPAR